VNVFVDTAIWSLALRGKAHDLNAAEKEAVAELTRLIKEGRARMIGLVRQELLSGIKAPSQYEKLCGILRSFLDESIAISDYEGAASASNECRAQGVEVSVSGMLICAIAIARDWSIFAADPDIRAHARILPLKLLARRK
jgi:predicted nucleic acid-binding protein